MSSVEEIYDEVIEEKVIDQMYVDQEEPDVEKEFIKKTERKWEFTEIPVDQIDRKYIWGERTVYEGHPCPVLISAGTIPMISLRDENFDPQINIEMTSCQEFWDESFQKIYKWLVEHPNTVEPEIKKVVEEEAQEFEIPRAVQGLAKLVEDARENLNEIWSPTMFTKKKKMRLLRDKKNQFLKSGADQIAVAIVQHINSLVIMGHYPNKMFGDYLKHSASVKEAFSESKITPLLDLVLCAEVVMPTQEELIPKKRIDTALPSAGG